MPSEPAQEAAAGVAADLMAEVEPFTEAPDEAEDSTEATDEVEQSQEDEGLPEITWDTPEELRELLEAPDFEDEEDDDEPALPPAAEQEYEPDEFEDPEKARLQKQLAKMQKKLAWAEEQKAKASRKAWADEASKYFQFANPDTIQAKSRRAFLKEAQRQHEAVAQVAKPLYEQLAAEKARLKEEARAEARAEAEAAWGRPTTGPTGAALYTENTDTTKRERLQQGRSLTDVLKTRIKSGDLKL